MGINNRRTKKIAMVAGTIIVVYVLIHFGYLIGITAGHESDIVAFAELLKKNTECVENNDLECHKIANQLLITVFNSKLSVVKDKGIFVEHEKKIDQYLSWAEATLSNYK